MEGGARFAVFILVSFAVFVFVVRLVLRRRATKSSWSGIVVIAAIGVDAVEIARIRRLWQAGSPDGERFVRRVFTDDEARYCGARHDPSESLAARFAAKEAVAKALGVAIFALKSPDHGTSRCNISGSVRRRDSRRRILRLRRAWSVVSAIRVT